MASRRAIVAGPQSYLEIGAGAGGGTDYLVVGSEGIVGAAASLKLYGDDTGSGTDKSIIIGEQGAAAATNVVHFFGTSTGPAFLTGTVKIHGNLEVEGTENVLGNATFDADATFKGNTTFGDAATDTVTFVAGVASDIQFDANAGGDRTIDIEASAGAGTNLVLASGAAGGAGPSNGGDITIFPNNPAGAGNYGEVLIGNPARVDPNDSKVGPAMLLNTGTANPAGFRWNSSDTKLQYRINNTTAWVDLVGGGGTLPVGSQVYEHLYWTGATWAPDGGNLTMPNGGSAWSIAPVTDAAGAPTSYSLTLAGANGATAGSRGGGVVVRGGNASGASADAGHVYIQGGTPTGAGSWGDILIGRAIDGTYDGAVYIGSGSDGGSPIIKVDIAADTIEMAGAVKFSAAGVPLSATVDFADADGSRIISDMVWQDNGSTSYVLYPETGAAAGTPMTLRGGAGAAENDGGSGITQGGVGGDTGGTGSGGRGGPAQLLGGYGGKGSVAQAAGAGGIVTIQAGLAGAASGGVGGAGGDLNLYAGDSTGNGVGGTTRLYGGGAYGTGAAGPLVIRGGNGSIGTAVGGAVTMSGGASTTTGGAVSIDGGNGTTTDGDLFLGTNQGEIVFGLGGATDNALYANSTTPGVRAGIRYNSSGDWEIRADNTNPYDWSALLYAGGPGTLPTGTDNYQILRWDSTLGTPAWVTAEDLRLPNSAGGGATRTLDIEAQTVGNQVGDSLAIISGDGAGTGATGGLSISTPNASGGGNSGSISITAGTAPGATAGDISITAGDSLGGSANTAGDITIRAGNTNSFGGSTTGIVSIKGGSTFSPNGASITGGNVTVEGGDSQDTTGGQLYLNGGSGQGGQHGTVWLGDDTTIEVAFGGTSSTTIDFLGNAGTRVVSDMTFDDAAVRAIRMETNATNGQQLSVIAGAGTAGTGGGLALYAGSGATAGGTASVLGGAATGVGATGGSVVLDAGTGAGGDGNVVLGDSTTDTVQFGDTAAVNIDFEGNASTRVTSDMIFEDSVARAIYMETNATNGQQLAVRAGAGTAGTGGGLALYAGSGATAGGTASVLGGAATGVGATGGDVSLIPGSGAGGYGSSIVGNVASTTSYLLFETAGASPAQATGPGFLYNDANGYMEVYNPDTLVWERIASSSGGGTVPDGTVNYQILRWDSTLGTPAWVTEEDLTLPANGGNATITQEATDTPTDRLIIQGHASVTGTVNAGPLWLYGGDTTGTGDGGGIQITGGSAGAVGGSGGDVTINGGFAGDGSSATVWIGDTGSPVILGDSGATDTAFYANSTTAADRAGVRYNDTTDRWQIHYDNGGVTWLNISTGEDVPTGSADGEIMEWDQTGTQTWLVAQNLALPDGGARTIGMKDHTAATAANALTVSGQANTSVGPGTTTGGDLTVKGGDSTAENAGDLILTGGLGSASNGDVLFGNAATITNIDFLNNISNRIISDIRFADQGAGSWSIRPDTPGGGTVGSGLLLAGAQGGATATGGFQAGGISIRGGIGGSSLGTGNGGDAGNIALIGDAGGAGGAGGAAGDGSDITLTGGPAGAVGATGGAGGAISAVCGASTGNIAGPALTLTAGASVGTGNAGNVNITAGANSSTANGGSVSITGGASTGGTSGSVNIDAGAGSTDGSVYIGAVNAASVSIGISPNDFSFDTSASPPVLIFNGTATINLPGAGTSNNFRIDGTAVSDNVDAPNLGTLTAGPTSDASALHTHTGLGALQPTSGEAITQYRLIAMGYDGANAPRAYHCDITSTPAGGTDGPLPIGFSAESVAITTQFDVLQTGEITIPAAGWALGINPGVTDVGKPVYAYGTAGQVSLTAPTSGSGDYRTKVGILMAVAVGTSGTIAIQIGDSVLMA